MIHQQALVDDGCEVGAGTTVWQFASIIRGAVIDEDCVIGACAVVDGCVVGRETRVGHAAQLHPGTLVGAHCFIGPGAILCNDLWPSTSKEGFRGPIDFATMGPTVVIEPRASIGAGAIVLPGRIVGEGAYVAAGAVVQRSVPRGTVYMRDHSIRAIPAADLIARRRVQPARW